MSAVVIAFGFSFLWNKNTTAVKQGTTAEIPGFYS